MRRGITLIELMVWSTLALVVLGLLVFMLIQVLRYARRESDRSHSFLTEIRSLNWLSQDLRYANSAGLVVHQGEAVPTMISIQVSDEQTVSEQAHFENRLIFYSWKPSEQVLRRFVATSPVINLNALEPSRPSQAELEGWQLDPRVERHLLADFVTSFKVLGQSGPLPDRLPGLLRLHLETTSPDGKQKFLQERLISVRFSS